MKSIKKASKTLSYVLCAAMVILIPLAPPGLAAVEVGKDVDADVLTKLGPRTATWLIVAMIALMAFVFWLFIHFGRRLSMRGYLGPLAKDAIARAEIARLEDGLREDLRLGKIKPELEPVSKEFKDRYRIPYEENPPNLIPGVTIDEDGRILGYQDGMGGLGTPTPGSHKPWPNEIRDWTADRLTSERKAIPPDDNDKAVKLNFIQREIHERFRQGYQREQLNAYYKARGRITDKERKRAEKLLPTMDVSSFGGGWVFVLEFTTIIFIVFAVLALGLLGVLKSEPIATILAAIAGYVLGKSTSIRGAGGEELRRGAEDPKTLFEAMTRQEEIRSSRDEEKIKLRREVEDLQRKIAQSKVAVPSVIGFVTDQAKNKIKEKNLLAEQKEVENSGEDAGKVFHQSPEPDEEVAKGSTVLLFIAKKPKTP
jgi:hypothetical protein